MTDEQMVPVEESVPEVIKGDPTKGHAMDVGAATLSVELPCGFIDHEGTLHYEVALKEMTGNEEDILAGKGPVLPRFNAIICNCLVQFGTLPKEKFGQAVAELSANDRMIILIAIRRISLGDFYDIKIACPSCKDTSSFNVDLSDLDILSMPDRTKRDREDTTKSGTVVKWHIMTAGDEAWLEKKRKKKEDVLTLAMLARVDAVDDVQINRDTAFKSALSMLKSLSMKTRGEIRSLFRKYEGQVDTEVEFECPSCDFEWAADMPVGQPSFFFPSGT